MRVTAHLAALFLAIGAGLTPLATLATPPPAPAAPQAQGGKAQAGPAPGGQIQGGQAHQGGQVQNGKGAPMAAHRALYQLTRASSRGEQVIAAHGTMGYEVADVCDGWATRQRLRMTLTSSEGQDRDMDSDYVTWEAKDGLSFRFHMVQKTDESITSQTDGAARLTRTGGVGEARYKLPKEVNKDLPPGTLFPMTHTIALLNAAREGKKFIGLPLFDGTDENGIEDSSIAILDWKPPSESSYPLLTPLASTRVRLAFFDRSKDTITPAYEVAMRYWENGIADDMLMDFGDFVMRAKLTELTPLPRRC